MKALLAVLALLVVVGLGWFLYSSPTAPTEMTEAEIAEIEAEAQEALDGMLEAWGELDCDKVQALYHPEFSWYAGTGRIIEYAGVRGACESFVEGKDAWKGYFTEMHLRVLSRDLVQFSNLMGDTIWFSSGRVVQWPGNCANVGVLEHTVQGWKQIVAAQKCGPSEVVEEG